MAPVNHDGYQAVQDAGRHEYRTFVTHGTTPVSSPPVGRRRRQGHCAVVGRSRLKPTVGGGGSARYDPRVHTLQRRGSVQPDDLAASLPDYVVIDVRDRSQFELGHIPGSALVPIDRLNAGWVLPDIRVPVAVLGESDADAEAAAVVLAEHGLDAITISGGAQAWRTAGQCFVTNQH